MKKFLQTLLILSFLFTSGQKVIISGKTAKAKTFHFDFLVHYSASGDIETRDLLGYINSKNKNYALRIIRFSDTDVRAKLFSAEDKQTFNFKVKESIHNGEVKFSFEYIDSSYLGYNDVYENPYSFTTIDDKTIRLDIYKNNSRKKILESHTMKIGKYNAPLYNAYHLFFVYRSRYGSDIQYPQNIFVEEAALQCGNGKAAQIQIQEIRKIDFDLPIK